MKITIKINDSCTKENYEQLKAVMDNYLESEFKKLTRSQAYVEEHGAPSERPFTIYFDECSLHTAL